MAVTTTSIKPTATAGPLCACCRRSLSVDDRASAVAMRCGLTALGRETVAMILAYQDEHVGVSPTLQELADAAGISKPALFDRVYQLQHKGAVGRNGKAARSIRVLEEA